MTADSSIESRLQSATKRYLQTKREVELARENLVDVVVDAQAAGWTQRGLEEVLPVSRVTINTWDPVSPLTRQIGRMLAVRADGLASSAHEAARAVHRQARMA